MSDPDIIRLTGISLDDKMRLLGAEQVKIRSDNGWWRADRAGYTDQANAAIYTGADAYEATAHCGPEKSVAYYLQPAETVDAAVSPSEDLLDWFAEHLNLELSWGAEDEESDAFWRVHRRNGGVNDREWALVAIGQNPAQAIANARVRLSTPEKVR